MRRGIVKRSLNETTAYGKNILGSSGEYLVRITFARSYLCFCLVSVFMQEEITVHFTLHMLLLIPFCLLQVCDPEGHAIVLSCRQCEGGLLRPTRLLSVQNYFQYY